MNLTIRPASDPDLDVFFVNQTDAEANYLAAFTAKAPHDREAYLRKWKRLLRDETVHAQAILWEGQVIGCVVKFVMADRAELTYAIGKAYWGRGLTTAALRLFRKEEKTRPLYARGKVIEEWVYRLEA